MILCVVISLFCLLFGTSSFAQSDGVAVNLPLAPTAAGIAKYGEVPVDESTGIPSIGVPLTSLSHRGVNISVGLSYHAGGIRVSDEASWVGLGWSLSGGGMITRAIRGHDDFGDGTINPSSRQPIKGYVTALEEDLIPYGPALSNWFGGSDGILYQTNYIFNDFTGPPGVNNFSGYCSADNNTNIDMQSDLYSFNLPGGSGKFFINKNGEPQLVSASDTKIEFSTSNSLQSWIIRTPDGTSYHLGGHRERVQYSTNYTSNIHGADSPLRYRHVSAWYLDKIITAQGEEIVYDYHFQEAGVFPVPSVSESRTDRIRGIGGNIADFQFNNNFSRVTIGCEATPALKVVSGNRYDEITLKEITAPYGKLIFDSNYDRSDLLGGRKLYAIRHLVNGKLIKKISLSHENIRSAVNPSIYDYHFGFTLNQDGNRFVVFPQEGTQSYEYAPARTHGRMILREVQVLGDDASTSLPPHHFEYDRLERLPGKTSMAIDAYGFFNDATNRTLIPIVHLTTPTYTGIETLEGADRLVSQDNAKIGTISSVTYPTGGTTHFEFESNSFYSSEDKLGPGLRVTSVTDYSGPDAFAKKVSYNYKNEYDHSSGSIYNEPILSYGASRICDETWSVPCPDPTNPSATKQVGTISCGGSISSSSGPYGGYYMLIRQSSSVAPVSSNTLGSVIVYGTVEKSLLNENESDNIGKVVSHFHSYFNNGVSLPEFYNGSQAPLFVDPIIGSPISSTTYDKTGQRVSETLYEVESTEVELPNWNTHLQFQRRVFNFHAASDDPNPNNVELHCPGTISPDCLTILCSADRIIVRASPTFTMYADHTYWVRNLSTTTTQYAEDGGTVSTTQSTTYNPDNYAVASSTVSRAGDSKTISYRYPAEMGSDYSFMVDANMTAIPVEVTVPNGNVFTTKYSQTHLVPKLFTQGYSSSDIITKSRVIKFDPLGYPLQVASFGLDGTQEYTWLDGLLAKKEFNSYVQEFKYDDRRRLQHTIGVNGLVSSYTYDPMQRAKKVVSRKTSIGDGTERSSIEYNYAYGAGSNTVTTTAKFADAPSITSVSTFDGLGRSISEVVEGIEKSRSEYDDFGRLKRKLYMPGYGMTTIGYEDSPLGRIKSERPPGSGIVRFNHLSNHGDQMTETIDELGHSSFSTTDVFGRVKEQTDHLGNITRYLGYTADDNPLTIQPPLGAPYSYTFDGRQRLESKTIPGGGTTTFGYDVNNRIKSTLLPNGTAIGIAYDKFGREVRTFKVAGVSSGAPYSISESGEGLLTTMQYSSSGVTKGSVDVLQAALLEPDGSIGSLVTTTLSAFDEIGRPGKSTDIYVLDGEFFKDETDLDYDYRDLVTSSSFEHAGAKFEQSSDFDVFSRPDYISSTLSYSLPGTGPLDQGKSETYMSYNNADQLTERRLMRAEQGYYGEVFSYGGRGWLESINSPNSRSFDALLCEEPSGDVYEQETVEQPTSVADIFTAINNGDPVTITELDCVFEEPPTGECEHEVEVGNYSVQIGNPIKKGRGRFANAALVPCAGGGDCSPLARSQNLASVENITITGVGIEHEGSISSVNLTGTYSLNSILLATQQQGINKPELDQFRQDVLDAMENEGLFLHEVDFTIKSDADNCVSCAANGAKNYGLDVSFVYSEAKITHLEVAYAYRTVSGEESSPINYNWSLPTAKKGDRGLLAVPCKGGKNGSKAAGTLSDPNNSTSAISNEQGYSPDAVEQEYVNPRDRWYQENTDVLLPPGYNRQSTQQGKRPVYRTENGENHRYYPLHTRIVVKSATRLPAEDSTNIAAIVEEQCPTIETDIRSTNQTSSRATSSINGSDDGTNHTVLERQTITGLLFRESKNALAISLEGEGLPYVLFQGKVSVEQDEHNQAERGRIESVLQTWLSQREDKINDLKVVLSDKGKLTVDIQGDDLEFIEVAYSTTYIITVVCPDQSRETISLEAQDEIKGSSFLLHRSRSSEATLLNPNRMASGLAGKNSNAVVALSATPLKSPTAKKKLEGTICDPVEIPQCSPQQLSYQLQQVSEFQNNTTQEYLDGLTYPTTLQSVMLCDGSIVYLLADQVNSLVGGYTVLNSLTLNGPNDLVNAVVRGGKPNALFAMELEYERNGNIKKAQWKSTYYSPKTYAYEYDEINRIKSADYDQVGFGANAELGDDLFSVSNISYDAIGNIQSLTRRGMTGCGAVMVTGEIDVLTYNYPGNTAADNYSQLQSITDAAPNEKLNTQGVNPQSGQTYGYDGAGRMTGDPHRGLSIRYNHLDLPREIDSPAGLIQITYDANGQKRLYHVDGKYTRRYAGALTFEKKVDKEYLLEAATTGDGRLVLDTRAEELYAEYHHKDHLGNVRVSFTDRNEDRLVEIIGAGNEVTQVMDFYPFGLQQSGEGVFGPVVETSNRYRYNGKEQIEEIGLYDYGARWYDPAIARWNAIDPMAEKYLSISPYAYVANNPILFLDPDGMQIINGHQQSVTTTTENHRDAVEARDNYTGDKKSKIRKLERAVTRTASAKANAQRKYDAADTAISELQTGNPDLYSTLDGLEDARGTSVDVVVKVVDDLKSDIIGNSGFDEPKTLNGLTDTQASEQGVLQSYATGENTPWASVQSSSGANTATVFLDSDHANGKTMSHEGGHVKYNVQNFYSYLLWLSNNKGRSSGGHGGGNPSGTAADREERIYIRNTKE